MYNINLFNEVQIQKKKYLSVTSKSNFLKTKLIHFQQRQTQFHRPNEKCGNSPKIIFMITITIELNDTYSLPK